MQGQSRLRLVEFILGEETPEPGQVCDELDAAPEFSHVPQPLEAVGGMTRIRKRPLGHGHCAPALRDHAEKVGRVVTTGLQVVHVRQHMLVKAPGQLAPRWTVGGRGRSAHIGNQARDGERPAAARSPPVPSATSCRCS